MHERGPGVKPRRMHASTTYRFFVQCALGLETLLGRELDQLGAPGKVALGGVECRGDGELLQKVCLLSRLAESVRLRLKEFEAREFSELEKKLRALPFRAYLAPGTRVRVKVVCHQSKLWHSGAVEERTLRVLSQHVGLEPSDAKGAQVIHVRLENDKVQVSLDASGERMHRRGDRKNVEKASLRETLAAALCLSSPEVFEADGPRVLWDPFCGAGTIPLEMLAIAQGRMAGARRRHAFEAFRDHDAAAFEQLKSRLTLESRTHAPAADLRVILSDRSERAVRSARENIEEAGFSTACTLHVGDIEAILPHVPEGAFILTNPPYGKRIGEAGAVKKLLRAVDARPDLRPTVALVGGAAKQMVPKDRPALFRTKNGGLSVAARRLSLG